MEQRTKLVAAEHADASLLVRPDGECVHHEVEADAGELVSHAKQGPEAEGDGVGIRECGFRLNLRGSVER